ncbi:MAG TPA: MFS transporter [Steroidobacter sp.]|uniref:MFS transporter n=1 Tax=Steroidobacter sp. TaxID=1978227 RepID=UPI002ED8DE3F
MDPKMNVGSAGYQEFRNAWPVVLAAMFGIGLGLSPVPFYTIGMLAPELNKAFGWQFGSMMVGVSIMTAIVLVASPAVGWLADRYGVRRVALISVLLFGLSFMAFALGNGDIRLFYVTWGVTALFGAGTLPVTWTRAVANRFETRKGLALGLSLLGTGIFGFAIKPLTAWLIAAHGWRTAYVVVGALPLVVALPIAYFGFHDAGMRGASLLERRASDAARRAATPGMSLAEAARDWRFWLIAVACVLISFAVGGPIPNMENILRVAGFAPSDVVGLVALIGLSVIVGRILGGWLIDRFWAPGVAWLMLSLPALACWQLATGAMDMNTARLAVFLFGFAAGVEYDLIAFLVARYFGMKNYGAIYGALYAFFALGAGAGPVVFGRVFDKTGSYSSILLTAGVLFVVGASLLLPLGRYRRFAPIASPVAPSAVRESLQQAPATASECPLR